MNWPFSDPENASTLTTRDIVELRMPILHVSHDADDGSWQFHSANGASMRNAMVVALRTIFRLDPTVAKLADLPLGWSADRRDVNDPWVRTRRE